MRCAEHPPCLRIGRLWRFDPEQVMRWCQEHETYAVRSQGNGYATRN
jgi:hypothetical protein